MKTATRSSLLTLYKETAREFAARVVERFPNSVHSVVLYGSVARGTAGKDSDIDVLVLTDEGEALRVPLIDISEELDYDNDYDTYLKSLPLTAGKLMELFEACCPSAEDILREGVVLYDDGIFERRRGSALKVG